MGRSLAPFPYHSRDVFLIFIYILNGAGMARGGATDPSDDLLASEERLSPDVNGVSDVRAPVEGRRRATPANRMLMAIETLDDDGAFFFFSFSLFFLFACFHGHGICRGRAVRVVCGFARWRGRVRGERARARADCHFFLGSYIRFLFIYLFLNF